MQITITRTLQDNEQNEIRLEVNGVEIGRGEINPSDIDNYNNLKVYVSSPEHKMPPERYQNFYWKIYRTIILQLENI